MEDIILVGYGGHARSVVDCIERQDKFKIVGYTDNKDCHVNYPYLGNDEVLEKYFKSGIKNAAVGIGYMGQGHIREHLYRKLKYIGYSLPVIIDPSSIVSKSAEIEEGTFIGKMAVVNAEAKIGKLSIINSKALIEHECMVGDYSHVSVGAILCGRVKVGTASFVGANATVIQCVDIPENVIVPAGVTIRENYKIKSLYNETILFCE